MTISTSSLSSAARPVRNHGRWSARRTMAVAAVASAGLWIIMVIAARAVLGG